MHLPPYVLGIVRSLGAVAGWSALTSSLHYLTVPAHLAGVDPFVATLVVAIAAAIEHDMEASGKGALFGAVKAVY